MTLFICGYSLHMHPRVMAPLLAVVDLGGDPRWLWVIGGVFLLTFLAVCGIAYLLLARRTGTGHSLGGSTSQFGVEGQLPISKGAVDLISKTAAVAMSRPKLSPETKAGLDAMAASRGTFVSIYRGLMIAIGLVGLMAAGFLFRSHTAANAYGLVAAILALLSLGAVLQGLSPGPSIKPAEPTERGLLDKIQFEVTGSPLTISLSELDVQQAADALRQGR